jgi:hypothetical protein
MDEGPSLNRTICFIALTSLAALLLIAVIVAMLVQTEASTIAALAAGLGIILPLLGALLRTRRSTNQIE